MEKKEIKLSEFLRENGAYEKFVKNFDKDCYDITENHIEIANCFNWGYTNEGCDYWNCLYAKWEALSTSLKVHDMDWLLDEKEVKQDTPKIKTNIKMRVTPEQYIKVQEICFANNIFWLSGKDTFLEDDTNPYILIRDYISYTDDEKWFNSRTLEEVDVDLFIRTNGTCIEDFKQEETPQPDPIEKEYLVYVQNKGVPKVKHNLQSADDEAKRLANIEIGKEVHIVEIIKTYKASVIVEEIK